MQSKAIVSLLLAGACFAQQPPQTSGPKSELAAQAKPAPEKPVPGEIKIVVTAGEGAMNNIRARVAAQPVVQVKDEKDQPVAGAEVVFQLPPSGPGGVFYGWLKTQTVRTDANGEARAAGFAPNEEPGKFTIRVLAAVGSKTAVATINQTNGSGPGGAQMKSSRRGLWTTIAIIGVAAAVGGGVAASRGDSDTTTTTVPVTVSAGPITVGGPR